MTGNPRQRAAQGESTKSPDLAASDSRSSNARQSPTKIGYRCYFRLLTGGLLVRVQPEEPAHKFSSSNRLQHQPFVLSNFHSVSS